MYKKLREIKIHQKYAIMKPIFRENDSFKGNIIENFFSKQRLITCLR